MTRQSVRPRLISGAILAMGMTFLGGCGSGKIPVYPVSGQLLVKGKPAEGAFLVFHPKDGGGPESKRPYATTDAEGKFNVSTYDTGDGAPAGTYKVTVVWRPVPKRTIDPEGPDRLNGKYDAATKAGVPEVTVNKGSTDLGQIKID